MEGNRKARPIAEQRRDGDKSHGRSCHGVAPFVRASRSSSGCLSILFGADPLWRLDRNLSPAAKFVLLFSGMYVISLPKESAMFDALRRLEPYVDECALHHLT